MQIVEKMPKMVKTKMLPKYQFILTLLQTHAKIGEAQYFSPPPPPPQKKKWFRLISSLYATATLC